MYRGSTPTHNIETDIDLTGASAVYVTYHQGGTIITKTGESLVITKNSISVTLSQEDTLSFKAGKVQMQVRYVMPDGTADASEIVSFDVGSILLDGVIPQ